MALDEQRIVMRNGVTSQNGARLKVAMVTFLRERLLGLLLWIALGGLGILCWLA